MQYSAIYYILSGFIFCVLFESNSLYCFELCLNLSVLCLTSYLLYFICSLNLCIIYLKCMYILYLNNGTLHSLSVRILLPYKLKSLLYIIISESLYLFFSLFIFISTNYCVYLKYINTEAQIWF